MAGVVIAPKSEANFLLIMFNTLKIKFAKF